MALNRFRLWKKTSTRYRRRYRRRLTPCFFARSGRQGMTGFIPRAFTAAMKSFESYPVSPIRARPRACLSSSSAATISCRCPAVSAMWSGRDFVSTIAWSLVEKPPREWPKAFRWTPLFRPRRLGGHARLSRRLWIRLHPFRAAARGRSTPSGPYAPSSRSGCRWFSKGQTVPEGRAMVGLSSLGTTPLR